MEIWIPLIGGAAGGAIISGIFVIIKVQLDRRQEHRTWLRDRKLDQFTALHTYILEQERDLKSNPEGRFTSIGSPVDRLDGASGALLFASGDLRLALQGWNERMAAYASALGVDAPEEGGFEEAMGLARAHANVIREIKRDIGIDISTWPKSLNKTRWWNRPRRRTGKDVIGDSLVRGGTFM